MVTVAFAGTGSIVRLRHAPEARLNPRCRIGGFYSASYERAALFSQQFGGRPYRSLDQLLGDPEIDAVVVANVNARHAPTAVAALTAGKQVLCEKPIALTMDDCARMADAARTSARFLMPAHNMRFEAASIAARQLLREGRIGRALSFSTSMSSPGPEEWSSEVGTGSWFFRPEDAGFGVIADLGVHKLDLIAWLLQDEIEEVSAVIATLDKRRPSAPGTGSLESTGSGSFVDVDDTAVCTLRMKGGAIGTLSTAWTCYGLEDYSTVIHGSEGTLSVYADRESPVLLSPRKGDPVGLRSQERMLGSERHSGVIDAFVDALERNVAPPVSLEEGIESVRAVIACVESARSRRTVKLAEVEN
ncbi:Gfo/Idh/MocA family protein [Salinispira pacifica]